MRTHSDCTNIELAWTRVLFESPFFIEFPTNEEEHASIRSSQYYLKDDYLHIASYKAAVEYQDQRFGQKRKSRLILGVS